VRCRYPPTLDNQTRRGLPRYMQPSRAVLGEMATVPYIHPSWWDNQGLKFIVEGEKKAVAVNKRFGVGVMAIAGCANWHHPDPDELGRCHPWIFDAVAAVERVIIIPDGDIRRIQINRHYKGLVNALADTGVPVEVVNFSLMEPDKIDDWLVANGSAGLDAVTDWDRFDIRQMAENVRDLVHNYNLVATQTRAGGLNIEPIEHNIRNLLAEHPTFKDAFRFNVDTQRLAIDGNEHTIVVDTTAMLQSVFGIPKVQRGTVKACIGAVAHAKAFSPRRRWLMGLEWDGVKRLDRWMGKYLGAEDNEYVREVSSKALVAAVARTLRPGCMVDYMVILKGQQGIGKSSIVRLL